MLKLYQSNRAERLGDLLGAVLHEPLASPFDTELIVVPHMGMARWLTLRLADVRGLCANTEFQLPAGFAWRMVNRLLGREQATNPFDPELLQWRIFAHLRSPAFTAPGGDALARYVARGDDLDLFQLATRIAGCFDQYLVFRPDWIGRWEASRPSVPGDDWQAALWRTLAAEIDGVHWVALQRRFFAAERAGRLDPARLPQRVSLFGLSTLSPAYLEVLERLSRHLDIHCFLLNPSRAHWTETVTPGEKGRREIAGGSEALYLDVGNPLLASLGLQGRDLFGRLLAAGPATVDLYEEGEGESLLGLVQRDLLDLQDPAVEGRRPVPADDASLQVHACHSPMREVEILRDRLLDLFDRDPALRADDVLVMVSDMAVYAPLIESVFGESGEAPRIPFNLGGRGGAAGSALADALLAVLALPGSRFEADSLVSLLEVPAVRRRFGIADDELDRVVGWIEASGIRWGRDEASRTALGLPKTDRNTWRAGLDRLLLGFALPEGNGTLFRGVLPCDSVEGSDARLLRGLVSFVETLFDTVDRMAGPLTLAAWSRLLLDRLDALFLPEGDEEREVQGLRDLATGLADVAEGAAFDGTLPVEVVRHQCARALAARQPVGRLFSGGVTFGTLSAMRGVPFPVICMLGLDDGRFPANPSRAGFDLMAGEHRPGDRSPRLDDRYLFLETLLCARQALHLSYVGQDIRDNTPLPPSVLVSELLDYLDAGFAPDDGSRMRDRLPLRHPLQPFSRRYFSGEPGLFSYSGALRRAAASAEGRRGPPPPFFEGALEPPGAPATVIELDRLRRFIRHPTRFLLWERLGISLYREGALLENREPFDLDRRERERLVQRLVDGALAGVPDDRLLAEAQAAGSIPHGAAGERLCGLLAAQAERFRARLAAYGVASGPLVPVSIDLGDIGVAGSLRTPAPGELAGYRVGAYFPGDELAAWVDHLAVNAAGGGPVETRWLVGERLILLRPPNAPRDLLRALAGLYLEGQSRPLHLFPRAGWAYAEKRARGGPPEACLAAARRTWEGNDHSLGESGESYHRLAFPEGAGDVLDGAFEALCALVFDPLMAHREEQG